MWRREVLGAGAAALVSPAWGRWDAPVAPWPVVSGPSLRRARDEFEALADQASAVPLHERIAFVNGAINRRIGHADDTEQFSADVWLTPLETLALGCGDCEDLAIAKYFVLLAAGSPPSALRLLYAWHRPVARPMQAQAHVLALARLPFVDPLAPDSINPLAVALSQRCDLEPVLTFDRERVWLGAPGSHRTCPAQRLRPWREMLARIDQQPPLAHGWPMVE